MSNQHPITPSSELIQQWIIEGSHQDYCNSYDYAFAKSAQWGADQELKACCEWLDEGGYNMVSAGALRRARRAKPPSLKELALAVIDDRSNYFDNAQKNIIRGALETLTNDN